MGAPKDRTANFPRWGPLPLHQATPRPRQVQGPGGRWQRRQPQVWAAGNLGPAWPRGLARRERPAPQSPHRDSPSAAGASARSLVIQHPDLQTGGRGRSSSRASLPGLRGSIGLTPPPPPTPGPPGRAGPSPRPSPRRREASPPDARGGQAGGVGRRGRRLRPGSSVNDRGASRAARHEPVSEARQGPGRGATAWQLLAATSARRAAADPGAPPQGARRAGLTPKMSGSFPARRRLAEERLGGGVAAGSERAERRRSEPRDA